MLFGRDAEFGVLLDTADRALAGHGSAICVEGEPGIGKTALVDAAVDAVVSAHPNVRVVRAVGVESEFTLAHAGLLDLLTPLLDRLDALPARQRLALASALGRTESSDGADRFLVAVATLALLSVNAEDRPLLLVVDDLQWVDLETAAALHFSARRIDHDRVAVFMTRRCFGASEHDADLAAIDRLELSGLRPDDAGRLLVGSVATALVGPLVSRTGGNPLALLELTRSLSPAQRRGSTPLPAALPVGRRLSTAFDRLIEELSPHARRVCTLAAASLDGEAGPLIRALDAEALDAAITLAEVESAGVLAVHGNSVQFRHPLLRNAVWERASAVERRTAHATLAAVHEHRPGTRLRHLAEASSGPDESLGAELLSLAATERTRSGYAAASAIAERASSLLPGPGPSLDALADATEDAALSGDVVRMRQLVGRIVAEPADVSRQAHARALLCAGTLEENAGSVPRAAEMLTRAARLGTGSVRVRALLQLLQTQYRLGSGSGMTEAADAIERHADPADPEQAMLVDYSRAAALAFTGRWDVAMAPAVRALLLLDQTAALRDDPKYLVIGGLAAGWAGSLDEAMEGAPGRLDTVRSLGAVGVLPMILSLMAGGAATFGRHQDAFAYAGEAVELGTELGYVVDVSIAQELLAWELAGRGCPDQAQEALRTARRLQRHAGVTAAAVNIDLVEAFCALCEGDLPKVVAVLEHRIVVDGGRQPRGDYPLSVAPDLVEAYLGLGRREPARELAAQHIQLHLDSPLPDIRGEAHRLSAMIAADDDHADAEFEKAHLAHAAGFDAFSASRTRLAHGQRLRRSGERLAAREQLRAAAEGFRAMDLGLWVSRVESELAATGGTARRGPLRDAALTSQETRVALYVARGLTNREIAAALFLSPKTVEHHVTSVLRKRGLRSRVEVATAFHP